jgi:dTDP-4-dehydrorhamnose reductase
VRVLITGAAGQMGRALLAKVPAGFDTAAHDHDSLDITDGAAVARIVGEFVPEVIVNAAAYTAVDKAEVERDLAWHINAHGPTVLAEAAQRCGECRLLNISTDYVFSGAAAIAYRPSDAVGPLGVYGASKLAGERAIAERLGCRGLSVRTAWLYSANGKNFLLSMLRLMREQCGVRVVADQIGSPTAAHSLATVIWKLVGRPGIHGLCHWTDAGVASWYDFACAIAEEAAARGILGRNISVEPVSTAEFPTAAARPRFSLLDCDGLQKQLGVIPVHWRQQLRLTLDSFAHV